MLDVTYTRDDGTKKQDENVLVEVGADVNHKDLNEALAGMAPGESKTVKIAYDADTTAEGLAGRTVEYALALKAVKTKVVPAADDEFAKDLGEFGSLQELKDKLRRQLLAADERRVERETRDALVDALVARASFEVPDALVERHMAARTRSAARGAGHAGRSTPARPGSTGSSSTTRSARRRSGPPGRTSCSTRSPGARASRSATRRSRRRSRASRSA